ncbi:nucleoside hydrolase [Sciscionella sediminilitoris]|uniref:nucleoside hydrolase n=1 Tax=Sciscionella sediminilitoris TaxID=1445613 RepID=UPI0004DF434F|nr:nucleoside hydrolase [Sciscionella sp. SE31]
MTRKLVLDVDTGTDDAVAIMFAALHPELELLGVTTVNGNVPVTNTTDNTLRVLDWIGRSEIPVYRGLSRPLARNGSPGPRHYERDGKADPHGLALDIPEPRSSAADTGAVEFLVETLRAVTDPLTLVAVGPLSNIATALAIDPGLTESVEELVIMGGGHAVTNVTASAEFNIWGDPEAAAVVFSAGFGRLTLVPLDATHRALITRESVNALGSLGTPAGTACARFIGKRIEAYTAMLPGTDAAPVHDVVCTASLVRPELITTEHIPVQVETASPLTIGRTVMDRRPHTPDEPNAHVAFDADAALLTELLLETFG